MTIKKSLSIFVDRGIHHTTYFHWQWLMFQLSYLNQVQASFDTNMIAS